MHSRHTAGFSLVEMALVVAVIGIIAALAYPSFSESRRRTRLRSQVNLLQSNISTARSIASSSRDFSAPPLERVRSVAIRFDAADRYRLVATDSNDGQNALREEILEIVIFPPELGLVVQQPSAFPAELVFRSNGTLATGSVNQFVLNDSTANLKQTLTVSVTGDVQLK